MKYATRKFYDAIRKRYPHIRLIANTHLEEKGLQADIVDEHFYSTAEFFAENTNYYDNYDRKNPKIFLGELAVVPGLGRPVVRSFGRSCLPDRHGTQSGCGGAGFLCASS